MHQWSTVQNLVCSIKVPSYTLNRPLEGNHQGGTGKNIATNYFSVSHLPLKGHFMVLSFKEKNTKNRKSNRDEKITIAFIAYVYSSPVLLHSEFSLYMLE